MEEIKYTTWQTIEKPDFREKIKDRIENMTEEEKKYLRCLLEYVKGRGAIQTDILEFLMKHPVSQQNQANTVFELLRENAGLGWIQFVDEISKRSCGDEAKECLYNEIVYAYKDKLPEEIMSECLQKCKNAFEIRVEEEKYWDGNESENEKALMKQLADVTTVAEAVSKEVKMCEEAKEKIIEKINRSAENMDNPEMKQEIERLKQEIEFYKSGIKQSEQKNADLQKEYMQEKIRYKKLHAEFEQYKETEEKRNIEITGDKETKLDQILEHIKKLQEKNSRLEQVILHLSEQKEQIEIKDQEDIQQKDISDIMEKDEEQSEDFLVEDRSYMQVEEPEWQSKEEEAKDIRDGDKVGFVVKLVKKLKYKHFQKLDEKEKLTELCKLVDERRFSNIQKKAFMDVFIKQTNYDKIYKLFESGNEAELIAEAE